MRYIVTVDQRIKSLDENNCILPSYIRFTGDINEESAANFCKELERAEDHALKSKQDIIPIVIDSYGGAVYSLLSMLDAINACKVKVATVLESKGMSAGAALFTCGAEGYRFMTPNATLMIHEVSSWAMGKVEEIKASSAEVDRLNEKIFHIMAKNCGKKKNYFLDIVHEKKHSDWYLDVDECLKHNIANHVGIPSFNVNITLEQKFCLPEPPKEDTK